MPLKLLVSQSLDPLREPLRRVSKRLALLVEWLPDEQEPRAGKHHVYLLRATEATRAFAEELGSRVMLVASRPVAGQLSEALDEWALESMLRIRSDLQIRDQQVADLHGLLIELGAITRLTGLQDKLERLSATCRGTLRADWARVLLLDGAGRLMSDVEGEEPTGSPIDPASPLATIARERGSRVLSFEEIVSDGFLTSASTDGIPGHAMAVSLLSEKRLTGLLVVARKPDGTQFSDEDLDRAMVLGGAAGVAIDNLRLYRDARQAYDRLVSTQKQLLQVEKLSSLGQLSAGIAHEINNPLFVVMGNIELALEHVEGRSRAYLDKALHNAERIRKIVVDLREFYAPSRNVFTELDVNTVLENAIPIVRLQNSATSVQFELDLDEELPTVRGDDNQLLQVFTNLLLNAMQAMPHGGRITIRSRSEDEQVLIEFHDTGVGIPPEHLDRIFDPFFTTKRDWTGTGLGLSVSHTIVENHQGNISVSSNLDSGTKFTVRLPALHRGLRPVAVQEEIPAEPEITIDNKAVKVLVVDDEEAVREYVQEVLADIGIDCDRAQDAFEAMQLVRQNRYDIVILDNKMPGRSGMEYITDLIEVNPTCTVYLLTGAITVGEEEIRRLGFKGLLRKPCARSEILRAIKRAADG